MICKVALELGSVAEFISVFISILIFAVSSLISWQMFKKEPAKTYIQVRFEKVIYPIYKEMEQHLFQKSATDDINSSYQKCQLIVKENHMISGGKLVYLFSLPLNDNHLKTISREIDKEYDNACKQLGIPVRRVLHKYTIYRSRNQKYVWLMFLKYGVLPSLIVGMIGCGFLFLYCFLLK